LTEEQKISGAWEVYLYARDLLAKRMSYGMVAQSMLLIAFSSLAASRSRDDLFITFFQLVVGGLGVIYSAYQYFMVRNINDHLNYIQKKYLESKDLVFADYLRYRPRQRFSREFRQSMIILVFLSAWVVMLGAAVLLQPA
jgi:hypothetical protein